MHCTSLLLKLTAANKLPLSCPGYFGLDMQAMEKTIPESSFLIISAPTLGYADFTLPYTYAC